MRKVVLSSLVAVLMFAGVSAAQAEKKEDPNGDNNHHGLCTAFFNGEKKGHEKQKERGGEYPGPFQDFLDEAPDGGDEGDEGGSVEDLYDYCGTVPGGIGGNSDGRWDCTDAVPNDPTTEEDESKPTNCEKN